MYKSSFIAPLAHWRGFKGGRYPPLLQKMSRCPRCVIRGSGYVKPDTKDTQLNADLETMMALRAQQDTKYFPAPVSAQTAPLSFLPAEAAPLPAKDAPEERVATNSTDAFQVLERTAMK